MDAGSSEMAAGLAVYCVCYLVVIAIFGFIGYHMGKDKTIGPLAGALICAFLGVIGIIIVAVLPSRELRRPRRHGPGRRPRIAPPGGGAKDDYPPAPLPPEPEPVFELRFSCPKCGKKFAIQDPAKAGTKAKCSDCGQIFLIPEPPK